MDTVEARARTKVSDDECATGLRFKKYFSRCPGLSFGTENYKVWAKTLLKRG